VVAARRTWAPPAHLQLFGLAAKGGLGIELDLAIWVPARETGK